MLKKTGLMIIIGLLVLTIGTSVLADNYNDPDIVKQVQQALNEQGFDCGTPDGVAGQKTKEAILNFKKSIGFETDDTSIDDMVLNELGLSTPTNSDEASEGVYTTYSGSGDYVLTLDPIGDWYIYEIDGNAGSNYFGVIAYDDNGERIGSLVNTTEVYHGRVYDPTQAAAVLEIKAEGDWSIKVLSIYQSDSGMRGDTVSGHGDDVVLFYTDKGESLTADIEGNAGSNYFGVIGYNSKGGRISAFVNTTDPYSGTVLLKGQPRIFEIKSEDDWSITFNNDGSNAEEG